MSVHWEATDQFGNMFIGATEATSSEALVEDLVDMIQEVKARHSGPCTFSIDVSYGEISAPKADPVSHVLNVSWISGLLGDGHSKPAVFDMVSATLQRAIDQCGYDDVTIQGPWD
jgi:hypothetical protein